jgi:hypothetical protein
MLEVNSGFAHGGILSRGTALRAGQNSRISQRRRPRAASPQAVHHSAVCSTRSVAIARSIIGVNAYRPLSDYARAMDLQSA